MSDIPVGLMYSGGTSSRWAIEKIIHGEIDRPTHVAVFFADTGDEHEWTYEDVALVEERCKSAGIPFFRCADERETLSGMLLAAGDGRSRIDTPPLFVENQGGSVGRLHQQCTKRFKTAPLRRAQSAWLKEIGLPKKIQSWIGFANDEQHRATAALKNLDVQWATMDFPAIRRGVSRAQQRADFERWGLRSPRFSMCVECPFADPRRIQQKSQIDLAKVIAIDDFVRHGLEPVGVHDPCYLSNRLVPIEQIVRLGDPQPSLPGFELPGCDAGMCFL